MRSTIRTVIVLVLAVGLLILFLMNVDLGGVLRAIVHSRVDGLVLALATMFVSLALRSWRWQYLLGPVGSATFGGAFRATAVGFAASSVLPARAGELIRPYFLARQERLSATGAFATIILERLLDTLTVLVLLASYVFMFADASASAHAATFEAVKWAGATAGLGALAALAVLFVLAGNPLRLAVSLARLEHFLPSRLAGMLARIAEKFAVGLGAIRRPVDLAVAVALSIPLWLSITLGVWSVAVAFDLGISFTGSFLMVAMLVIGVALPTPGAVGGFHAMFRLGATTFFAAPDDAAVGAAIVLHALTVGPTLLLGLFFAAQGGLGVNGLRRLADQTEPGSTA
jgi:uncharacterized protein (TIRG00374 family)